MKGIVKWIWGYIHYEWKETTSMVVPPLESPHRTRRIGHVCNHTIQRISTGFVVSGNNTNQYGSFSYAIRLGAHRQSQRGDPGRFGDQPHAAILEPDDRARSVSGPGGGFYYCD